MTDSLTGLLIIHNDSGLLKYALNSIKNAVSHLVVVDGAYKWIEPFCRFYSEDPKNSRDNLCELLQESGIPFSYYSGIWDNETEKRKFGIEVAPTNHVLLVDSDEYFDLNMNCVGEMLESPASVAKALFPLYIHKNYARISKGLNSPPGKQVLVNKANSSISDIVDSLFLLVPEDERKRPLPKSACYSESLGFVHHLSHFRCHSEASRRARFYSILSARVSGQIFLGAKCSFNGDNELLDLLSTIPIEISRALVNSFRFSRIAANAPAFNQNQTLISYTDSNLEAGVVSGILARSSLRASQSRLEFLLSLDQEYNTIFSNKPHYLDLTCSFGFFSGISFDIKHNHDPAKVKCLLYSLGQDGWKEFASNTMELQSGRCCFQLVDCLESDSAHFLAPVILEFFILSDQKTVDIRLSLGA